MARSVLCYATDKEQQAFEGWGTSLCWFANVAGGYPDPQRNYLADLLFDPQKGLGLQICRYNIGGSGWGTLDVPNFRYGANIERCASDLRAEPSAWFSDVPAIAA